MISAKGGSLWGWAPVTTNLSIKRSATRSTHRVSRFEEALAIIHPLLRMGRVDFAGRYYQARNCELRLSGPRLTGPPIVVGTSGARGTALAARHADGWHVPWGRTKNSAAGVALL